MKIGLSYRRLSPHNQPLKNTFLNSTILGSPIIYKSSVDTTKRQKKSIIKKSSPNEQSKNNQYRRIISYSNLTQKIQQNQQYHSTKTNSRYPIKYSCTKTNQNILNYSFQNKLQKIYSNKSIINLNNIHQKTKQILFKYSRKLNSAQIKIKQLQSQKKLLKQKLKKYQKLL